MSAVFTSAAILGTGSFGTALAWLLARRVPRVEMIGRDPAAAREINATRHNPRYLPGVELPPAVSATADLSAATHHPLVVLSVPTAGLREVAERLAALPLPPETVLLSCAKGIERGTGARMSEILHQLLPANPVAVISGPNHAEEIAANLATCAVIGSPDEPLAVHLQELFTTPRFRPYTSTDVAGIELGGAIKNVYAIASGIAHGLGLGDNATAALITRALAEMTRLGVKLGGRVETFHGLSGVGDLIATCYSEHSRNFRVGRALGRGQSLAAAVAELGMVAEGVPNTLSVHEAVRRTGARAPIIDAVHGILYEGLSAHDALTELLNRDPRPEHD